LLSNAVLKGLCFHCSLSSSRTSAFCRFCRNMPKFSDYIAIIKMTDEFTK